MASEEKTDELRNVEIDAAPYDDKAAHPGANEDFNSIPGPFKGLQSQPGSIYDLSEHKILIIFNHFKYKKTRHYKRLPKARYGTYHDVISLEKTFRDLGFMVITHDDWDYKDIIKYLSDVCKKDHSGTSCLAVAIMTHGKMNFVNAADRPYPVNEVINMVQRAPSLAGKPKLFFIQACRPGHTEGPDHKNDEDEWNIHADADSFVLYSSYEDFVSYRSTLSGSWMMQSLCKVINEHRHSMNLTQMATSINKMVSRKSTIIWNEDIIKDEKVKQMTVVQDNLLKFLKF